MGGYNTSFSISDPVSSLAAAVNDALAVAGGKGKGDDDDGRDGEPRTAPGGNAGSARPAADGGDAEEKEEERDHDEDCTALFAHLQRKEWGPALARLRGCPAEARIWVYRLAKKVRPREDVEDADGERPVHRCVPVSACPDFNPGCRPVVALFADLPRP